MNSHVNENEKKTGLFFGEMVSHLWISIVFTIVSAIIVSGVYPVIVWGLSQALFHEKADGSLFGKDGMLTTDESQAVGSALLGQPFGDAKYFHPRPSFAGNGYDPTASGGTNYGPLNDRLLNGATNPATTQPAQPETLGYDGIRLRTIHYAVDNGIPFKLYHAVYVKEDGASASLERKDEVPLSQFENKDGTLNDVALVDAFPHPTMGADAPDFTRVVVIAGDFATAIPADAVTSSASGLDPHISPANAALQVNRVAAARHLSPDKVKELVAKYTDGPDLGFLGDPGVNVLRLNLALDQVK